MEADVPLVGNGSNDEFGNGPVLNSLTGSEPNPNGPKVVSRAVLAPRNAFGSRPMVPLACFLPPLPPEKFERFNVGDFKRWQHQMFFYLNTLGLTQYLTDEAPELGENPDAQTVIAVNAWRHADYLCKNYILNRLDNTLYNMYCTSASAKAIWESLEKECKIEHAGTRRLAVGRFLGFKMVDSKPVMSQVEEYELILRDIEAEGMVLSESFQVAALIEKLPAACWKDFKDYLKRKRKEMTLQELITRLRVEEEIRLSKKNGLKRNQAKDNKKKRKRFGKDQSGRNNYNNINKPDEFTGNCYVCEKSGHRAKDCRNRKFL